MSSCIRAKFIRPDILLQPQIPKPLHGVAPRVVYGNSWWYTERMNAYAKNNQHCWACGVFRDDAKIRQGLEAHESYLIDHKKGRMEYMEAMALCHLCHNYIHSGRLHILWQGGKIAKSYFDQVIKHGDALLIGLIKPVHPKLIHKVVANWEDWRLILDGESYGPSTQNYQEWREGKWRDWKPEVHTSKELPKPQRPKS